MEINKLAAGLDPSCTYIKKQTYEDVTTFKARLSERFEYSGDLNEDYLRSLMGRAVTRRRGELMKLINKGGSQPNHIDSEVWGRLLKLAQSKQWEEKSEQGKKANASRKTLNRTGNRGISGVRESLRERFGRSPDPDEVFAEVHRPKGSTVTKEGTAKPTAKWEEHAEEGSAEDSDRQQSLENSIEQRCSNEGIGRVSHPTHAAEVENTR